MNEQLLVEFKNFKTAYDERFANVDERIEKHSRTLTHVEQELSRGGGDGYRSDTKSLSEILIEGVDFAELKRRGRGKTSLQLAQGFFDSEVKATVTSAAVGSSTPGILVPQRMQGIVSPGVQTFRVRDLMPRYATANNAIEFIKENAFTNTASPVAETVSKPESSLTFTIDSSPVRTIAHFLPASRQVLDDLPALRGYIDQRLLEGLRDIEDYELVAGDGQGQHISGLINEASAYDTSRNAANDTKIDTLNHAISQVEDVKLRPSGIVLNPRDWRAMQLTKDAASNVGNYILGGPKGDAQPLLWGLPIATTPAVPLNHFFVGDFQRHCAIWDRMQAVVEISTEHADFFVRNMVAILAEERIAFTQTRADATVYGSFV